LDKISATISGEECRENITNATEAAKAEVKIEKEQLIMEGFKSNHKSTKHREPWKGDVHKMGIKKLLPC
jgi:hypothetical protein